MRLLSRFFLAPAAALAIGTLPGLWRDTVSANQGNGVNDLNISQFRVEQSASELQIIGLDSRNLQVGKLNLRVNGMGRSLTVEVRGQRAWHKSQGQASLRLPLLPHRGNGDINAFLREPRVSSELQKRGITLGLQPTTRAADQPSHECTFGENLAAMGTSCCEMPGPVPEAFEEFVCTGDRENYGFVDRICTKPSDPNNPCGPVGANGCAVCWAASYNNYCRTVVDPQDPTRCRYEFR